MAKPRRIIINMDDWDLGDWPLDLADCIDVEINKCSDEAEITIKLKWGDSLDAIVKKIAKEAIESEYEALSGAVRLTSEGIEIPDVNGDEARLQFTWDNFYLGRKEQLDTISKAIETRLTEIKKEMEE